MPNKDTEVSQPHAQAIEAMKNQLLIVLINRLGSDIKIPVSEIDDTGDFTLSMSLDQKTKVFNFKVNKKH